MTQVGNGSGSPYKYPELTAGYIVKWIQGAKSTYGLDIDYVGVSESIDNFINMALFIFL